MRLEGKRAVVTGSSKGIGAEVAKVFAREGASVVLSHRPGAKHKDPILDSIVKDGGKALMVHCDVSDPSSTREMFEEVKEMFGGLDILVNTAGAADPSLWGLPVSKTNLGMWRSVFDVDVFGTFNCTKEAIKLMGRGSSILNVASTPALSGDIDGLVYASAKGAVVSMTRMLAKSLAPKTRVNCMAFGSMKTGWLDWLDEEQRKSYRAAIPMDRFGTPQDAAALALFLASDESSFITGQVIVIDGGEVMR